MVAAVSAGPRRPPCIAAAVSMSSTWPRGELPGGDEPAEFQRGVVQGLVAAGRRGADDVRQLAFDGRADVPGPQRRGQLRRRGRAAGPGGSSRSAIHPGSGTGGMFRTISYALPPLTRLAFHGLRGR